MSEDCVTSLTARLTALTKRYLTGDVAALYLRGSVARNEQITGLSDIDFFIVTRKGLLENYYSKTHFDKKLKPISDEIHSNWAQLNPSIRIISLSNLYKNNTASFLTGIDASLLFGTDVLRKISIPSISELSKFGIEELDRFLNYWINETMGRKIRNISEEISFHQNVVLKLAQMALLSKRILEIRKQKVANAFFREFSDFKLAYIVNQAQNLRLTWPDHPKEINLNNFIHNATIFPLTLQKYLSETNSKLN